VYSTKRERECSRDAPLVSPLAPGGIEPAPGLRDRRVVAGVRGPANPRADGMPAADVVARAGNARARSAALKAASRGSASRRASRAAGARAAANARVEDMRRVRRANWKESMTSFLGTQDVRARRM